MTKIAIKNMTMPKYCAWDCPLCREDGGACQLVDIKTSDKKRPKDCPLVEIKALQEPKTGYWIGDAMSVMTGINYEMCSCCRRLQERRTNYCPNCGAKMESEVKQ